eukprot:g3259.t1
MCLKIPFFVSFCPQCFWFSQGCTIGCPSCTGYHARDQVDTCGRGMEPKVCDPRLRTYNKGAECGSKQDIYRWNPWRAPGTAPVFDSCGRAGGGYVSSAVGPGAAMFTNTSHNKQGDYGSKVLPRGPSQATWKAGSEVETMWGLRANHGGGFQWRLCPVDDELTEACFARRPLPFVGRQAIQYANGTRMPIHSKYAFANGSVAAITADGELPPPDHPTWALNPLPDNTQQGSIGAGNRTEFPSPCPEDHHVPGNNDDKNDKNDQHDEHDEHDEHDGGDGDENDDENDDGGVINKGSRTLRTHWDGGLCSGERPFQVSVVDVLRIPVDTPPGDYVLGWRWDVEETAQVWSSCSDITIVA